MKQMKKQLAGLMAEVFDACETPDGKKVEPPSLETPRSLKGLRKGRQLTFAEVNELAAKKAPVWVEYEGRDRGCDGAFWVSRSKGGGWDFDDGLGLVIVEKDGTYGPLGDKGKKWNGAVQYEQVGQKYDPKAMFLSTYVYGVYEAVKRR
jgi:hypothetical protein